MATSGGGSSFPTSSAYGTGDGAVGGKFQKRFFSKSRPTPYDRPRTALRNPNWVSKLFIDPASKLVAASARRFFSSVFQKRLPPPSTPLLLPPVLNPEMNNGPQDSHKPKHSEAVQSTAAADSQILISKDICGISELEQLLKQKTLTRHEIDRLTELLQSKAVDFPVKNDAKRDVSSPSKPVMLKDFWLENTRNGQGSHQTTLTPGPSARVPEEDNTAPAELAIALVGSCPLKESSGMSFHENRNLLCNSPSSPRSSVMSLERTTTVEVNVLKNGFPIPRSRGRSAIYRMAGTSFLRMHQTTGKESECNGSLLASTTLLKQNGEAGWKEPGRKRSSAMLDDDVGSVGPIRRTRGRHGFVSHNASLPFGGKDVSNGVLQPLAPNYKGVEDTNKASTSYNHVPPSFHEAASGILQKDEQMKQKEELSESKLITDGDISPSKSTYMVSGKVLKSFQSEDSLKLVDGAKNGEKLEDLSHRSLNGINSFNSLKQKRAEKNDPKKSGSYITVSTYQKLSSSVPSDLPTVRLAQVTRIKHGFKMSVDEDFFDLDEDTYCNEPAAESSVEEREHKTTSFDQIPAFAGNLNLNKTPAFVETSKTHVESVAGLENSSASGGNGSVASFAFQTLTLPAKTLQPVVHPPSSSSEKSKYVENSFASVSEVSTPKFSSWVEPVPSTSNRPGGANNHSLQVPGYSEHEENNLAKGVKGNGKPDTQISVPFSSSMSSSISASILPEPSNINNGPTKLSTPAHTSATSSSPGLPALKVASTNATSTAVSLPVALNAESSAFKNKTDTSASMSPFDFTSTAFKSNGSSLFGLGSRTDFSAGKFQSQGAGSVSGSTIVTVPEITPLHGSSALTSAGTSGVASIAPFSSSTPALFGSTPSFGISNQSSLSELKSDTSGSNLFSSIFTSSSTASTVFSAASAVSSISSSIPNNIIAFGTGSASVTNVLSNVATTLNTMPSSISPALFSSSGETPKPGVAFGSTINPALSSSIFPFTTSTYTAPSIGSPMVFGAARSSAPVSSFPTASPSPTPFTNFPSTFMSNSNNDQMSPDSMAEDPVQSQPVVVPAPVFGQHPVPSMPTGISFGSVVPPAAAPEIQFTGQQSQNPLLQGPGNFDISNGGKFSLGSVGGDDKSSRRIVRVRNRLRK